MNTQPTHTPDTEQGILDLGMKFLLTELLELGSPPVPPSLQDVHLRPRVILFWLWLPVASHKLLHFAQQMMVSLLGPYVAPIRLCDARARPSAVDLPQHPSALEETCATLRIFLKADSQNAKPQSGTTYSLDPREADVQSRPQSARGIWGSSL